MGVQTTIGSDIQNFVNDVPRVPKYVLRWVSTTSHFFMGSQMKFFTAVDKMRVPESIRSDAPNFVKDVPRVPKCVLRWGSTTSHFLMGS